MEWSWMAEGFEWISLLLNELTPPPLESTWDVPHSECFLDVSFSQQRYFSEANSCSIFQGVTKMHYVFTAVEVVHHDVSRGTMTGAMKEVMIATMIAMTIESTDHTGEFIVAFGPIFDMTLVTDRTTAIA